MEDFNQIAIKDTKSFTDIVCMNISEKEAYDTLDLVKSALNTDGNILAISEYSTSPLNSIWLELRKTFRSDDTEKTVINTPLSYSVETANLFNINMVSVRNGNMFYISLDDIDALTSIDVEEQVVDEEDDWQKMLEEKIANEQAAEEEIVEEEDDWQKMLEEKRKNWKSWSE